MEKISLVDEQDLPSIQIIEDDAFPCPWQPKDFEHMLSSSVHFIKITSGDNDELVLGFAILHVGFPNCDMFKLAVHPDHRSKGLGRRLVEHCVELSRDSGESVMLLNARDGDDRAMKFYQGMGFVAGAVLPEYYHYEVDGEPVSPSAIVMSLTL